MASNVTGLLNVSESLEAKNNELFVVLYPMTVILFVILILGTFANVLVIYIYAFVMKRNKEERFFIPWLAFMDACSVCVGSSFGIYINFWPYNARNYILCTLLWTITKVFVLSGAFLLLVIAVQRYLKLCRPFGTQMNMKWKVVSLTLSLILGILLASPVPYFYGVSSIQESTSSLTYHMCGEKLELQSSWELLIYKVILSTFALVGIIIISILYGAVSKRIYKQILFRRKSYKGFKVFVSVSDVEDKSNFEYSSKTQEMNSDEQEVTTGESIMTNSLQPYSPKKMENVSDSILNATEKTQSPEEDNVEKDSQLIFGYTPTDNTINAVSGNNKSCCTTASSCENLTKKKVNLKRTSNDIKKNTTPFSAYRYSLIFVCITIVFLVSFIPRIVVMILESLVDNFWLNLSYSEYAGYLVLHQMYLLNGFFNPLIYAIVDPRFREAVMKEFSIVVGRCRKIKQEFVIN